MKIYFFMSILVLLSCNYANNNKTIVKKTAQTNRFKCIPCGYNCDTATYNSPGTCSSCKMELVSKESINFKNILIDSLCALTDSNTIFLDVRTVDEFKGTAPDKFGVIKNAVNIPVQVLEERRKELDKFKNKNIVVYCSHAHRSAIASYKLAQNGFNKISNLLGGMSVWKHKMNDNNCNSKLYLQQ